MSYEIHMNWDDWCKVFPAREVFVVPDSIDVYDRGVVFDSQKAAEQVREKMEEADEISYEVVRYRERFYIIRKD